MIIMDILFWLVIKIILKMRELSGKKAWEKSLFYPSLAGLACAEKISLTFYDSISVAKISDFMWAKWLLFFKTQIIVADLIQKSIQINQIINFEN